MGYVDYGRKWRHRHNYVHCSLINGFTKRPNIIWRLQQLHWNPNFLQCMELLFLGLNFQIYLCFFSCLKNIIQITPSIACWGFRIWPVFQNLSSSYSSLWMLSSYGLVIIFLNEQQPWHSSISGSFEGLNYLEAICSPAFWRQRTNTYANACDERMVG